jgi:hypothetical protein
MPLRTLPLRAFPLALLVLSLAATSAAGQSTDGGPYGGRMGRMHGFRRGTAPDPVVLKGPPAPDELAAIAKLPPDRTDHYKSLYDRFMSETKPQRDSLAALRNGGGEDASDIFLPLNDELTRRQAAFDDELKGMLDKTEWKSYQKWRDQQRKDADKARMQRWRHRGSDAVPPA